jgi:hypothetical protein
MKKEQLREYCEAEYENIDAVLAEIVTLMAPGKSDYSTPELAALATFIHNCYNGFEKVLKLVLIYESIEITECIPSPDRKRNSSIPLTAYAL